VSAAGDGTASAAIGPAAPAAIADSSPVSIIIRDGSQPAQACTAPGTTVADALTSLGIALSPEDRVSPSLTAALVPGMEVHITRIRTERVQEIASIPFHYVFKMSHDVTPGQTVKDQTGVPGVITRTYLLTYVNDQLTSRKLIATDVTRKPVDQELLAGIRTRMARALPSRGGTYRRLQCMDMVATGYSPYEGSSEGRCANGMRAGYGIVAVDPRVIPLGTKLYIEGYGYAIAGDTGGAIKGHRVDLGHTTYREADAVGRRHVRVWIISGN
jgi:3D (Asp-Asp-Asp) domain-containing protein